LKNFYIYYIIDIILLMENIIDKILDIQELT
jgi:hypothetical protein